MLAEPSAHLNQLNTVFVSDTAVVFKMHLVLRSLDWVAVLWGELEKNYFLEQKVFPRWFGLRNAHWF